MGTITGYGSKHSHEFKLTINETSTSTSNNTSEISFSFTVYRAGYSWSNWNSITYNISINGTSYSGTIPSYSAGSTMTIKSGNQTVGHNSDGTKSINYSFSVTDNSGQSYTCGNASASGTLELTKIPRYTTVTNSQRAKTINSISINWKTTDARDWTQYSLNGGAWTDAHDTVASDNKSGYYTISNLNTNTTYKIKTRCKRSDSQLYSESSELSITTYDIAKLVSTPNVNIGSAHTVTWTNPGGASTSLKLCKTDNSTIIDYGTVTGTSKSITTTANTIYALTPNSNTYKARYIITTTANGKSYTNSKDFTFTVTNSNPTFSNFTYQDTNTTITALTGNNQILVSGYSNVKAAISTANKATAKNSATMKTYKLAIGNKNTSANYNASADVNMSINQVNNSIIDVYAIDSRGNSTKVSKTATIKNYSNIKIKSLSATRQNNVGTVTTLKFEGEFWNANFGSVTNAVTSCKYKYKATSSSTWTDGKTTLTYTISGNKITGSLNIQGDKGTDGFNTSDSYNIQLTISDRLSTATSQIILGSGNPALAIYKNNVAIGQQYNTSEGSKLQVNGDISEGGTKLKNKYSNISHAHGLLNNNMTVTISNTTTDNGWSMINSTYNGFLLKSMRFQANSPNWGLGDYSAGVCFGGADTKGIISLRYNIPTIKFAGGNGTKPVWNFTITGTNGKQYTLPNTTGTILIPQTLYDNTSGTTGTVTLSETAANFSYLEIFVVRDSWQYSIRVYAPNGKTVALTTSYFLNNNIYLYSKLVKINGTSITVVLNKLGYFGSSEQNVSDDDKHKIIKVVGYR